MSQLGDGGFYHDLAFGSFSEVDKLKKEREAQNKAVDAQKKGNLLSGVASGALIGFQLGGPWGAAIGGGIGLLGGLF